MGNINSDFIDSIVWIKSENNNDTNISGIIRYISLYMRFSDNVTKR